MGYDVTSLEFLNDAANFLIEGRRALKWTYCYGFFIEDKQEKDLFEFY